MTKLTDTKNVSIDNRLREFGGVPYKTVYAVGDGNCALNALMLGLLDLIKRDQFRLEETKQQALVAAVLASRDILQQRLALYRGQASRFAGQAAYADLAADLNHFLDILHPGLTYPQLIQYLKDNSSTRVQVAALHVAFPPALRAMGVKLYRDQLAVNVSHDASLLADAQRLKDEGVPVGHEVLSSLAAEFGLNLKMHSAQVAHANYLSPEFPGAPQVTLVHEAGKTANDDHWNFLLPANQEDGLAAVLSGAPVSQDDVVSVMHETESLINGEAVLAREFASDQQSIAGKLPNAAHDVKKASKNLLHINQLNQPAQADDYQELLARHSENTKSILTSVRNNLGLTNAKLKSLKVVGELEEALLMGTPVPDVSDIDARLAHTLQNSYVLSFLSRHYAQLAGANVNAAPAHEEAADTSIKKASL